MFQVRTVGRRVMVVAVAVAGVASAATALAAPRRQLETDEGVQAVSYTSRVVWGPCPKYSAGELKKLPGQDWPGFTAQLSRMRCGRLQVPLDWGRPGGRKITLAFNQLPARDRAHRIGALAINPGGPGGSGWFMSTAVATVPAIKQLAAVKDLVDRYDLVGFDPRGVGYSTRMTCPAKPEYKYQIGVGAKRNAQQAYQENHRWLTDCGRRDPAFARSLTTETIARDLDAMRAALGERKLNYLGISWGTRLGAMYRSMFPKNVGRFVLDSSMWPQFHWQRIGDSMSRATEAQAGRFAAWLAKYHRDYRFGATGAKVLTEMARIQKSLRDRPKRDARGEAVTGDDVAALIGGSSDLWPYQADMLRRFRDLADEKLIVIDPLALRVLRQPAGFGSAPAMLAPFAMPQEFSDALYYGVVCNEDTSSRKFEDGWKFYLANRKKYPLTGGMWEMFPICGGWPYPGRDYRPGRNAVPLQIVAHLRETITPAEASDQLQRAIGGAVLRLNDDFHGGMITNPCGARRAVDFYRTGKLQTGDCPGPREPRPDTGAERRITPTQPRLPGVSDSIRR